ncbi:hypothetical protein PENTCL1PPCAC_8707, partial [Pristionchus entomophagus]
KSITMKDDRFSQLLEEYSNPAIPAMTPGMKRLLGFGIGGTLLLVLITVVCCIVWRRKKGDKCASES